MPNPIDQVPLLWLATWVGQVTPVFFLVGGFANPAALGPRRRQLARFLRPRLTRLLRPTAVFLGDWTALEVLLLVVIRATRACSPTLGSSPHRCGPLPPTCG